MSQVQGAIVYACILGYFEDAYVTAEFDYYAEEVEDDFEVTPDETLTPTPEVNENYVGANLLLTRGNNMVQGRVRKRAQDNDGNPIGIENENPILDIREHVLEFKDDTEA